MRLPRALLATAVAALIAVVVGVLALRGGNGLGPSTAMIAPESILAEWHAEVIDPDSVEHAISREDAIDIARETVYPPDAWIVGARFVRVQRAPGPRTAWAVDFDTSTGDLNNPELSDWLVSPGYAYYSLLIDASSGEVLFAVDGGPGSPVFRDVEVVLMVSNVDGPPLEVTPWEGAEATTIPCPGGWLFARRDAPDPPWHFVVKNGYTGEIMREETIEPSERIPTVIVRRNSALFGYGPASAGGPALEGCLEAGETE
jgi:hypothetical protein